jgi:hypothetical protein
MWYVQIRLSYRLELIYVRDMLAHLASVSNVPLPEHVRRTAQKRTREPEQAAAVATTSSPSTEAEGPRAVTDGWRAHAYPATPLDPASVFALEAPSLDPSYTAQPRTSLDMFAPGLSSSSNAPSGGWVQTPPPPVDYPDGHTIDVSGVNAFASALGGTGEQLPQWAYTDPAVAASANTASYPFGPIGASGADLDAIGTALDALLSRSGHAGADDPLALWTRAPMNFESASSYHAQCQC